MSCGDCNNKESEITRLRGELAEANTALGLDQHEWFKAAIKNKLRAEEAERLATFRAEQWDDELRRGEAARKELRELRDRAAAPGIPPEQARARLMDKFEALARDASGLTAYQQEQVLAAVAP